MEIFCGIVYCMGSFEDYGRKEIKGFLKANAKVAPRWWTPS